MTCQHKKLCFGSGTYYLFCRDCSATWVRLANDRKSDQDIGHEDANKDPQLDQQYRDEPPK